MYDIAIQTAPYPIHVSREHFIVGIVDVTDDLQYKKLFHQYCMQSYLRAKIEELETNSKIQNIRDFYRGISDFKKGYQPRCNILYLA